MSRRAFGLGLCGLPLGFTLAAEEKAEFEAMPWNAPATVVKLYLSGTNTAWPTPLLDERKEVAEVEANLALVQKKNAANVRFVGGEVVKTAEEARAWRQKLSGVDGVLIIAIAGGPLGPAMEQLDLPVLYFSRPYAGHTWSAVAGLQKQGRKIAVVATSNYDDLDPYMRMFRTAHHLRASKVLVACENAPQRQAEAEAYSRFFGTTFEFVGGKDLKAAFDAADQAEAGRQAEAFTRAALRVVEPSPQEIVNGLRFYLGVKSLMKQERANAVTVDCFGTLAAKTLPGYPCIAWSKLNDVGLYGVCEADIASTMTQMMVTSYARVPGFVSDPVFDLTHNEVIHAHCVSATRMKGISEPPSPYIIRNHLETNEGAVLQVLMPVNEPVTVARLSGPSRMLITTGLVTGTVDADRGCRSKIRTRVADAEAWLNNYSAGLHRVVFYGNHLKDIQRMGKLMGFEVANEMA
jgi:L-fucose isomerase-like protein